MNAVWHGWAIPMFLFLAILRLSLNYLIARWVSGFVCTWLGCPPSHTPDTPPALPRARACGSSVALSLLCPGAAVADSESPQQPAAPAAGGSSPSSDGLCFGKKSSPKPQGQSCEGPVPGRARRV